jgi:hypothetical protein
MESKKHVYELHVIVRWNESCLFELHKFSASFKHKSLTNVRATLAQTEQGDCPCQPMLTCAAQSETDDDAVAIAKSIADGMEKFSRHLNPIRVKVEAMVAEGGQLKFPHYYEFHFRINTDDWNKAHKVCWAYTAHLFFNALSRTSTFRPVVTLRRYDMDFKTALKDVTMLRAALQADDLPYEDKLHCERSVYDSNVGLDHNWLFKNNDPKDLI